MKRRYWSDDEVATMRSRYPHERTIDIARAMGRTERQVYEKAAAMGLKKSAEYLASPASGRLMHRDTRGQGTRFGQLPPWNKGQHYEPGGRSVETRFKKGNRTGRANHVYKPVGTERMSKDGYLERKIHDGMPMHTRWRAVHIVRWEEINGPLPKGHALSFRDGNKLNHHPSNMDLITRAELMKRNTIHRYPSELKQVIRLSRKLQRTIEAAHEKQN